MAVLGDNGTENFLQAGNITATLALTLMRHTYCATSHMQVQVQLDVGHYT